METNKIKLKFDIDTDIIIPNSFCFLYIGKVINWKTLKQYYYTGITNNPGRRFVEHSINIKSNWKKTWHKNSQFIPEYLEYLPKGKDWEDYEKKIKNKTREQKRKMIMGHNNIIHLHNKVKFNLERELNILRKNYKINNILDLEYLQFKENQLKEKWKKTFWCMVLRR